MIYDHLISLINSPPVDQKNLSPTALYPIPHYILRHVITMTDCTSSFTIYHANDIAQFLARISTVLPCDADDTALFLVVIN